MKFGKVIDGLSEKRCFTRRIWKSEGIFIRLSRRQGERFKYCPQIDLHAPDGNVAVANLSHMDLMATDWQEVPMMIGETIK